METFLPNLLDWDVYSEVVRRANMIRVCSELEKRMKEQAELIDSLGGDECYIYTHPARSLFCILPLNSLRPECSTLRWRLPSRQIDRIIGDIIINGRTYCLPSRYYLGGKLLRPVGLSKRGMCVWFDIVEQGKLLAEMEYRCEPRYSAWAKKQIYDYLVAKE